MKVVWKLDAATVRDVYEILRVKRTIAYTTVMTMMKILEEKGYLKKVRVERAYVYRPTRPRQQVRRRVRRACRGCWCSSFPPEVAERSIPFCCTLAERNASFQ